MKNEDLPGGTTQEAAEAFDAQQFLAERHIDAFADRLVKGHNDELVPLAVAVTTCIHARTSIEAGFKMANRSAASEEAVKELMGEYIQDVSREAQTVAPEVAGSIKKG